MDINPWEFKDFSKCEFADFCKENVVDGVILISAWVDEVPDK